MPLAGALIGLLGCKVNPATMFLGNCGSPVMEFLLPCLGLIWSQGSATLLGLTALLSALALSPFDVFLAIGRCFLKRHSIFGAEHGGI